MPTIVETLRCEPEPLPEWLVDRNPPRFDREAFFGSRTVYYPASGRDGQPVMLCSLSHAAHCFIYVDYTVSRDDLSSSLYDPRFRFRGYEVLHDEQISEDALRPDGWSPHLIGDEARNAPRRSCSLLVEPFGWFVALKRRQDADESHGPRRLAILFIGGDGFASYDALYCQEDGTPPPFLMVIHDRFDRCGLLDRIARRSSVLPKFLLVADRSKPWRGYADTGADAEPGGMGAVPRRLFRRVSPA